MVQHKHVAVRLDDDALARLARVQEAMGARMREMGFALSQSDAIRAVLSAGLPVLEEQWGITPGAPLEPLFDGRKTTQPSGDKPARQKARAKK